MRKKYVTIVRVENPDGAVTVNEQYLPLGTCRRYDKGKLSGSVEYRDEREIITRIYNISEIYKKIDNFIRREYFKEDRDVNNNKKIDHN